MPRAGPVAFAARRPPAPQSLSGLKSPSSSGCGPGAGAGGGLNLKGDGEGSSRISSTRGGTSSFSLGWVGGAEEYGGNAGICTLTIAVSMGRGITPGRLRMGTTSDRDGANLDAGAGGLTPHLRNERGSIEVDHHFIKASRQRLLFYSVRSKLVQKHLKCHEHDLGGPAKLKLEEAKRQILAQNDRNFVTLLHGVAVTKPPLSRIKSPSTCRGKGSQEVFYPDFYESAVEYEKIANK